jgi:outer membrane protein assembly factor BamB
MLRSIRTGRGDRDGGLPADGRVAVDEPASSRSIASKSIGRMSCLAVVVSALLTWAAPAMASEWSNSRGDAGNTGSQGETLGLPLTERWHSSAPRVEENGAVVSGGVAYMSSNDGKVYAFEVKSGEPITGFPVATSPNFGTPAVDATNKKVYALAGTTLYAFEFNGTTAWTKEVGATGNNYNVGPVVDGGFVYLNAASKLQKYDSTGALQWSSSGAGANTQPAVMGSFVYLNSEGGQIRKYDKSTGKEVTTGGFPIAIGSSGAGITAANSKVFIKANKLFAYNASNGEALWSAEDGGENEVGGINDSPAVLGGFVYTFGWDGKAYAFNETTGAPATGFPSAELNTPGDRNWSSPAVAGDKVYIGAGTSQKLKVLGAAGTGSAGVVLAEYPTFSSDAQGFDLPSPVVAEGFVFAMLDGGGLYAFSPGKAAPGKIKINGGSECTTSRTVTLEIEFGTNTEMRISEDPLFTTASFEAVAATKSFELSAGFGEKTVYIQFKDKAGDLSNVFNAKINFAATCSKAKPTTTTTALSGDGKTGASITVKEGSAVTDQATIAGESAATATGKVTYKVYSDKECTKEVTSAGEVTVSAGKAPASEAKTLPPGTYYWQASYGGDEANEKSSSKCGDEVLTVEKAGGATGTCGKTTVGKKSEALLENLKRVNACVLPVNATVSELVVYLSSTSRSGSQVLKGIVYADSKGKPAGLLGTTSQLTFTRTSAAGWYKLPFSTPLKLPAGNYWIGIITGGSTKVAAESYDTVANAQRVNTNKYSSGPSNPFGSFKTNNEQMSLYAPYTASGGGCSSAQTFIFC